MRTCDLADGEVVSRPALSVPGCALDAVGGARFKVTKGHHGVGSVQFEARAGALLDDAEHVEDGVLHAGPGHNDGAVVRRGGVQIGRHDHCGQVQAESDETKTNKQTHRFLTSTVLAFFSVRGVKWKQFLSDYVTLLLRETTQFSWFHFSYYENSIVQRHGYSFHPRSEAAVTMGSVRTRRYGRRSKLTNYCPTGTTERLRFTFHTMITILSKLHLKCTDWTSERVFNVLNERRLSYITILSQALLGLQCKTFGPYLSWPRWGTRAGSAPQS